MDQSNWAGNYRYAAAAIHRPASVEQAQELVRRATKIKALGTRHSFNSIADSEDGELISLENFRSIDLSDLERDTVTVGGGVRYGDLCRELHARGYALHNLASLPHISVAGACATATHGSGDANGNLATAVVAMELITADGQLRRFSRDAEPEIFPGLVVNLGAVGIVTRLTLRIVPAFDVAQRIYQNLPMEQLDRHFDAIMSSAYSVSLFTDWRSSTIAQIWLKRRANDSRPPLDLQSLGATPARRAMHPIAELSAVHCTQQLNVAGPWHERLPHFRMEFTPSSGQELQSEYFVPRRFAVEAIYAIDGIAGQITPHLHISEIRSIAADDLWMSPCLGQPCVTIHFTWKKDWPAVREVLPRVEAALEPFEARPHWGKLSKISPARLQSLYPKLPDFRQLLHRLDPSGKFRNLMLDSLLN